MIFRNMIYTTYNFATCDNRSSSCLHLLCAAGSASYLALTPSYCEDPLRTDGAVRGFQGSRIERPPSATSTTTNTGGNICFCSGSGHGPRHERYRSPAEWVRKVSELFGTPMTSLKRACLASPIKSELANIERVAAFTGSLLAPSPESAALPSSFISTAGPSSYDDLQVPQTVDHVCHSRSARCAWRTW